MKPTNTAVAAGMQTATLRSGKNLLVSAAQKNEAEQHSRHCWRS
jgi:hypothetical protein